MLIFIFFSVLSYFLRVKLNYADHTDTNHNTKSFRYQCFIGGNNAKTVDVYLIDIGLLKKAEK